MASVATVKTYSRNDDDLNMDFNDYTLYQRRLFRPESYQLSIDITFEKTTYITKGINEFIEKMINIFEDEKTKPYIKGETQARVQFKIDSLIREYDGYGFVAYENPFNLNWLVLK